MLRKPLPLPILVAGIDPHPPCIQQRRGIRFRHLDGAVIGDGAVEAGKQLDVADTARRAQTDHRAGHLPAADLFSQLPVVFEDPAGVRWGRRRA